MNTQEKTHCAESIAYGLNRVGKWRRKTDVRYPGDYRNIRAADALAKLASESVQLTDEAWNQLKPYYCYGGVDARWRESVAQAARQVGFYQSAKSFPAFVDNLIDVLSRSSIAA
jgi:hypothetical protein